MIRQLRGTVVWLGEQELVLDVNGVGYKVAMSHLSTAALDTEVTLHTHLAVRETALDLYGFSTLDELEVFELLITLPKVGPKSALGILAQADIALLKEAVLNNDASYLSKMSGIGKKTAEKIVHELHERFADRYECGMDTGGASNEQHDIIDALVALGYPLSDARATVKNLPPELPANEAVRVALKDLSSQ